MPRPVSPRLLTEEVGILNPEQVADGHGNAVSSFEAAEPTVVAGRFAPQSTSDGEPGRDARSTTGVLYLAPDAPIRAESRVIIGEHQYEVVGQPALWAGAGWEVTLRSVVG